MAITTDINRLASKLNTKTPLKWVVKGLPVGAFFGNCGTKERDSLGEPTRRNQGGDLLRLWIGSNDSHELFVTLTIKIKVSPNRKKGIRLMFLTVPAESLRLQSDCVDHHGLDNFVKSVFDVPSDAESGKCKFLRMTLHIESLPSEVIMPDFEPINDTPQTSLNLLRKLKRLSESPSFDLYATYDPEIQSTLEKLRTMLVESDLTTPIVDLKGFYAAGRPGVKNMWANQGWFEEEASSNGSFDAQQHNKNRNDSVRAPNPSSSLQPPPAYQLSEPESLPHVPLAAAASGSRCCESSSSNIVAPPALQKSPFLPSTAIPSSPPLAINASVDFSSSWSVLQQTNEFASVTSPTPSIPPLACPKNVPPPRQSRFSTPESSLSPGYTATFLSGFTCEPLPPVITALPRARNRASDRAVNLRANGDLTCERMSKDYPDCVVEVTASTPEPETEQSMRADIVSGARGPVLDLSRKRPFLPSSDKDSSPPKRVGGLSYLVAQNLSAPLYSSVGTHEPALSLSPTVIDDVSYDFQNPSARAATEFSGVLGTAQGTLRISLWMQKAWRFCPMAHHLITELSEFAVAERSGKDVSGCHVNCTLALLRQCTKERLGKSCKADFFGVSADLLDLTSWLYKMRPGADMSFFSLLLNLSLLECQMLHAHRNDSGDYDTLLRRFMSKKARIVGQAYMELA